MIKINELISELEEEFSPGHEVTHLIAAYKSLCQENEKLKYVPGQLRCKKCRFSLIKRILYMKSGNVGVNRAPDDCPNGCGPMWRIAWPDHFKDYASGSEKVFLSARRENKELRKGILDCKKDMIDMSKIARLHRFNKTADLLDHVNERASKTLTRADAIREGKE